MSKLQDQNSPYLLSQSRGSDCLPLVLSELETLRGALTEAMEAIAANNLRTLQKAVYRQEVTLAGLKSKVPQLREILHDPGVSSDLRRSVGQLAESTLVLSRLLQFSRAANSRMLLFAQASQYARVGAPELPSLFLEAWT